MFLSVNSYQREVEVAVASVREAAQLCRAVQAGIDKNQIEKKDRSPVTIADFGSQALICRTIKDAFSADPIIAEEDSTILREPKNAKILIRLEERMNAIKPRLDGKTISDWIDLGGETDYSDRFWTLDPIDGTKGFLRGDQYAIALCLIVKGELAVAVLGCPNLSYDPDDPGKGDAGLFAVKGEGAFMFPLKGNGSSKKVSVSDTEDATLIRFCESVEAAHSSHGDAARIALNLGITTESVRIDSQAKYALVAQGQGDAYLRLPKDDVYREKIWDHAAGALIVAEAGGEVTDILGKPLDFTLGQKLENNRGIIATNGKTHGKILAAISSLGIGKG